MVTSASSKDSFEDNWMKKLGSEVAGSSKDSAVLRTRSAKE